MDLHAEIRSKRNGTVTPCIHFLLRFRGICQSGIRSAISTCCCSHISTQTSDFGVEPWTFHMEFLPFLSTASHSLAPLYVFEIRPTLCFWNSLENPCSVSKSFFTWWHLWKAMCVSCPAIVLSGYFGLVLTGPTGHPFDADPPQWEHCGMVVYM